MLLIAALWIADKIPFAQHVDQQVEAAVYRDGIVSYLLISEDMEEFALMTTEQGVIATSPALCELYTSHIPYHDGSATVTDLENIPKL